MQRRDFLKGALASGSILGARVPALSAMSSGSAASASQIRRVLVMFKCHFDVGFTNTQGNVVRTYFSEYYPEAMRIAATMRDQGKDRYVWTTGSWLLYEYLEQAGTAERKRMEQAIHDGDIAWHALPFSWQTEMLSRSMIQGSLGLAKSLDSRFGCTTRGAKMTDVPCHSRGIIRPLAEAGILFLDIGVNPTSTAPHVPAVFVWKNPQGQSLVMMYHISDYGGIVEIPGSDLAVAIKVRGDNSGSYSLDEVKKIYEDLRRRFPNATVTATNLNGIAAAIDRHRDALPVVTGEMGDTWIYGVPSDPVKVARYRELVRLRQEWIDAGRFRIGDTTDLALLRKLLLAPEHTWGTDTARYLDNTHYKPADLRKVLTQPGYVTMARSWAEKRDDIDGAVHALPAALESQARRRLEELVPTEPSLAQLHPHDPHAEIATAHFVVSLNAETGAITRLQHRKSQREWASAAHPLVLFTYQTLSNAEYEPFLKAYTVNTARFGNSGFDKPGIDAFQPQSRDWHPAITHCWAGRDKDGQRILAQLAIDDAASQRSGLVAWPSKMYFELLLPDAEPVVHIRYSWFQKPASRLPEAMWLTFQPDAPDSHGWTMQKVDQPVSPYDVLPGGNRSMHAISDAMHYQDDHGRLSIAAVDAPVVALGVRSPVYFSTEQPEIRNGLHFSLYNNGWGTNYIQWFGEDMSVRFSLSFQGAQS